MIFNAENWRQFLVGGIIFVVLGIWQLKSKKMITKRGVLDKAKDPIVFWIVIVGWLGGAAIFISFGIYYFLVSH